MAVGWNICHVHKKGCRFNPWSGGVGETVSRSVLISLSLSLKGTKTYPQMRIFFLSFYISKFSFKKHIRGQCWK